MKNTSTEGTVFRKKGFFIAIYSCLGIVAVLALVITFNGREPTNQEYAQDFYEDAAPVGADQVQGYLAGVDQEAWFRPRQPDPPPTPTPQPDPTQRVPPTPPPTPGPVTPTEPVHPDPVPPPEPPSPTPEPEPTPPPEAAPRVTTFAPFEEGDRMVWPVYGETVMPFSDLALIYDPTLDQFRTNDNLRIAADEGDAVRAGAYGRVVSVGRSARQGNYIVIDHGNGWVATYGQLMENILVSEGDIVAGGQVLGGIGQPSIFGHANGTHLHLRIERDDVAINPYYVLTERS